MNLRVLALRSRTDHLESTYVPTRSSQSPRYPEKKIQERLRKITEFSPNPPR